MPKKKDEDEEGQNEDYLCYDCHIKQLKEEKARVAVERDILNEE